METHYSEKKTGKILNKEWSINAAHALYYKAGTWYHNLKKFPGALIDENGYFIFDTAENYYNCPFVNINKHTHAPHGISSIPGYVMIVGNNHYDYREAFDVAEPDETYRRQVVANRIIRDTALAISVKRIHNNCCQICGFALQFYRNNTYSEAHHIKPIGSPHNGPDIIENLICVCPNCHAQLDYGAIEIDRSKISDLPNHVIANEYVDYHNTVIFKGNDDKYMGESR